MKLLLTGASGYIGKRLLPVLVENGHEVVCCVRDTKRFTPPQSLKSKIKIVQVDLLDKDSLENIPKEIDGAFYLVHSMSSSGDYAALEELSAINFRNALNKTKVNHVVYLGGIANELELSKHLTSRKNVELELAEFGGKFRVYSVPNIMNITYGRGVGYKIEEEVLDEETQKISATKIREQMRKDGEL